MAGSIETAASLGSGVHAQLAGPGSIGDGAPIGAAARGLDEVLRQLQEKYTLWQQRLDAHVEQVSPLFTCISDVATFILLRVTQLCYDTAHLPLTPACHICVFFWSWSL